MKLATMFGYIYMLCETSFFKMTFLKNKYRSRLTDLHLENTLRTSCSPRVSNFKTLAQDKVPMSFLSLKYQMVYDCYEKLYYTCY